MRHHSGRSNASLSPPPLVTGSATWSNTSIGTQTSFTINYDIIPTETVVDVVTGVSPTTAAAFGDMACIIRLSPNNIVDAINGGAYGAVNISPYYRGVTYHIRMVVNVTNHTYSAYVTQPGGTELTIASNYAFRTEQASATQFINFAKFNEAGDCVVKNIAISGVANIGLAQGLGTAIGSGVAIGIVSSIGLATGTSIANGVSNVAVANARYVDPDVASSGNGLSWATAWKSLSNMTGLAAGYTVYISGGPTGQTRTYNINGAINNVTGFTQGSAGNPVTYQIGQDSSHNGTIIFNNTGSGVLIDVVNNIVISGDAGDGQMHIQLSNYPSVGFLSSNSGVRLSYINLGNCGVANWRVFDLRSVNKIEFDHIYANMNHQTGDAFIYADHNGPASFDDSKYHHITLDLAGTSSGSGPDGFELVGSSYSLYNCVITNTVTTYTGGQHMDGWQDTGGSSYIKIYNNKFINIANYPCFGDGYYGGFNHLWVYNNLVIINRSDIQNSAPPQGIAIGPDGGALGNFTFNDVLIYNNTIVDYGGHSSISFWNPSSTSPTFSGCFIRNNVIINSAGINKDAAVSASNNVSYTSAQAATRFTSYSALNTSNNLHPTSSATELIGQGMDLSSIFTTDLDGNPRGSSWTIGCYQFT